VDVLAFLIASVCVFLFPTVTVPNDTDDGVEVNDAAWDLAGAMASANSAAGTTKNLRNEICRREGPPGWMLFRKVCWETLLKRFWGAKNQNPYKFILQSGYEPRSAESTEQERRLCSMDLVRPVGKTGAVPKYRYLVRDGIAM